VILKGHYPVRWTDLSNLYLSDIGVARVSLQANVETLSPTQSVLLAARNAINIDIRSAN
jgi:hypothetical protein